MSKALVYFSRRLSSIGEYIFHVHFLGSLLCFISGVHLNASRASESEFVGMLWTCQSTSASSSLFDSSVYLKIVSTCSGKPISAPPHFWWSVSGQPKALLFFFSFSLLSLSFSVSLSLFLPPSLSPGIGGKVIVPNGVEPDLFSDDCVLRALIINNRLCGVLSLFSRNIGLSAVWRRRGQLKN